jgi:two-component system sensor histidine kinase KdpD
MSVPLVHRDGLLGILNVTAPDDHRFEPGDLELLSLFAEHAASGIAHARMHAEERHRIDEMVRLEQMKSEFITGVSHDLRTPLTSIVGCTAVAKREDVDAQQRAEMLAIVEGQAQRLSAMVERMLLSAELGIEAQPATLSPFDLMAAADEVAESHRRAGHTIRLDGPLTATVIGDRMRLQQALDLLLENAFRHGAPPVVVSVSASRTRVSLTVSDRGPGIAAADRERVFDRFVRLDASRGTPGVGLGLSIVRGLVSTMGGAVHATEPRGGGVAFVVELVAAVPEQRNATPLRLVSGG